MIRTKFIQIITFLLLLTAGVHAQYEGKKFNVSVNYNYTTTAEIYLNPKAASEALRSENIDLEGLTSYSSEFRYRLNEDIILGASLEMMEAGANFRIISIGGNSVVSREGFNAYMLELHVYYFLPFSTELFKFFMGGGTGFYTAERVRKFGDAEVENTQDNIAFGIQVSTGMEFIIREGLSLRGEMKFRDPQIETSSKYTTEFVHYNETAYALPQDPFTSEININGTLFSLGLTYSF